MRVLAERKGMFGLIRIMERQADCARLYCIKSSVQTMVRPDGISVFGYVHAAKLLLQNAHSILLIGGAGGSLATMLARRGKAVTVVDIDPAAEELAGAYFGLDSRVHWVTGDALAFLEGSHGIFDGVAIDACDCHGLVKPFDDPDVVAGILARACPNGSLVVNIVYEDGAPPRGETLACNLVARGLSATLYRAEDGWEGNEVLHVRTGGDTDTLNRQAVLQALRRRSPSSEPHVRVFPQSCKKSQPQRRHQRSRRQRNSHHRPAAPKAGQCQRWSSEKHERGRCSYRRKNRR
jgi:SAM-dependent methyltransferase